MQILWDFLRFGIPTVTTVTSTVVAVNQNKKLPVVAAYGVAGWVGGYLFQSGINKAVDMFTEQLPETVVQPELKGTSEAPKLDTVMDTMKDKGIAGLTTEEEINAGQVIDIPAKTDLALVKDQK